MIPAFLRIRVSVLLAAAVAPIAAAQPVGAATNRATVVQHGDITVAAECVTFKKRTITGYRLLQRSNFEFVTAHYSTGRTVCWLDGEGCKSSKPGTGPGKCFCDPLQRFWGYWTQDADEMAPGLSGDASEQREIRSGSVDYWVWGLGQPPIQPTTATEVCS